MKKMKLADPMEEILTTKRTVLKLDYDSHKEGVKVSKTAHGYHIEIPFIGNDLQVLAMQVLLGSDKKREFFNMRRLARGRNQDWNVLFQEKYRFNHQTQDYDLVSNEVPL